MKIIEKNMETTITGVLPQTTSDYMFRVLRKPESRCKLLQDDTTSTAILPLRTTATSNISRDMSKDPRFNHTNYSSEALSVHVWAPCEMRRRCWSRSGHE